MIASISRLPVSEVQLALWLGKLVEYTAYALLISADSSAASVLAEPVAGPAQTPLSLIPDKSNFCNSFSNI